MRTMRLGAGILAALVTGLAAAGGSARGFQSFERPAEGPAVPPLPGVPPLIVHEWGTFTSIAGPSGEAVQWLPYGGTSDLPCFVRRTPISPKGQLRGTVRMETPVLYFYAPRDIKVDVRVRFRQGLVTEWFPHARVTPSGPHFSVPSTSDFESAIEWNDVMVTPHAVEQFPHEGESSHYYTARQTDAAPIVTASGQEKFLFYRGVGGFRPSLRATIDKAGKTSVWNSPSSPVGAVLLFENRGGRIAYRVLDSASPRITFEPLTPEEGKALPLEALEAILISSGLYPKEAKAMVATWRDSWFEEGTRLIYIVPSREIDAILPLEISPRPAETVRVFVGRLELITPAIVEEVAAALRIGDRDVLWKHGRFLEAIGARLAEGAGSALQQSIRQQIQGWSGPWNTPQSSCPQR